MRCILLILTIAMGWVHAEAATQASFANGALLIGPEFELDEPVLMSAGGLNPAIAVSRDGYLVVNGNRVIRLDCEGQVLNPLGLGLPEVGQNPSVASDGTNFLVAWSSFGPSREVLYAARVDAQGQLLDYPPLLVSTGRLHYSLRSTVAWNGTEFLLAWEDHRRELNSDDIYAARISKDGFLLDTEAFCLAAGTNSNYKPKAASNGEDFFVVWQESDQTDGSSDIKAVQVRHSGGIWITNTIVIAVGASWRATPAVASDGEDYFVVWSEYTVAGFRILGTKVTKAGVVLVSNGFPVTDIDTFQLAPTITWMGSEYLATWNERSFPPPGTRRDAVKGIRMSSEGVMVTGSVVTVTPSTAELNDTNDSRPAIGVCGTTGLVVWADSRYNGNNAALFKPYSNDNEKREFFVPARINFQNFPKIASSGTNYLLVWVDDRSAKFSGNQLLGSLYGARFAGNGRMLDSAPLVIATNNYAIHALPPASFSVGSSGSDFLIVWHGLASSNTSGLVGRRLGHNGSWIDSEPFAIESGRQSIYPAVASDGQNYFVAWDDATFVNLGELSHWKYRPYGAWVKPNGPTGAFPIITNDVPWVPTFPAVAPGRGGFVVTWRDRNDAFAAWVATGSHVANPKFLVGTNQGYQFPFPGLGAAVACGNDSCFVAWPGSGTTGYDIYGAVLSPTGAVSAPLLVSGAAGDQLSPKVAFANGEYLVVWQDSRTLGTNGTDIYGTRVANGIVLDGSGVLMVTNSARPELAASCCWEVLVASVGTRREANRNLGTFVRPESSPPKMISVSRGSGEVVLEWCAEVGQTYRVQFTEDVGAGNWQDVTGDITAHEPLVNTIDSPGEMQRYYRVRQVR